MEYLTVSNNKTVPNQLVVHIKKSSYDVLIDRTTKWGNPYVVGVDGNRSDVIDKFEKYLLGNKELFNHLHELRGKILGCWCSPQKCHGDILSKYANGLELYLNSI